MRIIVVSGFLGSGKTTFIKELIRRTGRMLVVLENEYGENDLDSRDLMNANSGAGAGELEILEFMEGCVCCTQKDSFSNTILAISASLDPDYLVIEPTGIGKLSNIHANIKRVSWERIELLRSIVVLTPRSLLSNIRDFGDICKDQISNAQIVVFSKVEQEDGRVIAAAVEYVRQINAEAEIVSQHYTRQDDAWWGGLLLRDGESAEHGYAEEREGRHVHEGEPHVHHGADNAHGPVHEHGIQQVTLKDARLTALAQLVVLLEDILRGSFGVIPRAKGVLQVGEEWMRFDVADGLYGIVADESDEHITQCVFIGRRLNETALRARMCNGATRCSAIAPSRSATRYR